MHKIQKVSAACMLLGAATCFSSIVLPVHEAKASETAPKVVASIRPLQSIAMAVMKDVAKPELLLKGNSSPHHASLRPSQIRLIDGADLMVWVGPNLETFLSKPLEGRKSTLMLMAEDHDEHEEEKKADEEEHHDDEHHHHDGGAHMWLDPQETIEAAERIATRLAQLDKANAEQYQSNLTQFTTRVSAWEADAKEKLSQLKKQPYIVFHDAYGPFAEHFGLEQGHALSPGDESKPGAARIKELQALIERDKIGCVFIEPDSDTKLVTTLIGQRPVKSTIADPLGIHIKASADAYFTLMDSIRDAFVECLQPTN